MRPFLLTVSILCGLVTAGLVFGWGFGIFDDPGWQKDALGWVGFSIAAFVASTHPLTIWIDAKARDYGG